MLREQLMRNKLDSRTVGTALLATQEELRAAFSREQACEEGYNALAADLDSCRVNQETAGQHLCAYSCQHAPRCMFCLDRACCCREPLWQGRSLGRSLMELSGCLQVQMTCLSTEQALWLPRPSSRRCSLMR